jgi:hypothetical protein
MTDEEFMDRQSEILATLTNDATEEEKRGRYFRRTAGDEHAPDRTLEEVTYKTACEQGYDEQHAVQRCGCRIINTTIVRFCPAHQAWWDFYDGHNEETREERWARLPEETRARFERMREESKRGAVQREAYGKAWRGVARLPVPHTAGKRKRTKTEGDPDT